ncbi:TetR/AcrR family transcriptional regulator [Solwaraspora sp. WMMD937]|uniref:TetR/AcrR family transcriptional regulator n=1 Tax=Solwaraspora sp. WMMD937 TaxID=3016090 RepID=UPI00249A6F72|nr:TetR/AcrR family transcriptional regulator [Solwaraspora sp. WMMD937]WFE19647.1 TetR/AcrR family transcriptional regulator [Solwaraspora sp. WMMD937]
MSTRDDLLAAATALLDEGGPERVTLREVGRRAGVSHNAPYKHFTDKQALLEAVAIQEFDRLDRLMTETPTPRAEAAALLRRVLLEYVRWAQHHPRRFALVYGWSMNASADLHERAGATWRRLVELTAEAQAAAALPAGDPERAAALVRALAHGAADLAITGHLAADGKGRASAEDLVEDLLRVLGQAGRSS